MQHFSEIPNYPAPILPLSCPLSSPLSGTAAVSPDFGAGQCAASFSARSSARPAAALRDVWPAEEDRDDTAHRVGRGIQSRTCAISPRIADAEQRGLELDRDPLAAAHQAGVAVHDLFFYLISVREDTYENT